MEEEVAVELSAELPVSDLPSLYRSQRRSCGNHVRKKQRVESLDLLGF